MITLRNINKSFDTPSGSLAAVKDVSLNIEKGDIYGIIGFSGAGKSTLLRTINLLERPDSGTVIVDGKPLAELSKGQLRQERQGIGMIFQHFHLLNNLTVFDNVAFPLKVAGMPKAERRRRVEECLGILDIADKINTYPSKLSGGQKQRVAIARSIANRPGVLLCDEPTSSVDPQTTGDILKYLAQINRQLGITIVLVTHEMDVVRAICNKVAVMEQGIIVENFSMNDQNYLPKSKIASFLFKRDNFYADEVGVSLHG
ncbi:methionine ABC transporter ATP-binding protein [Paenibacillus sp. Leaf72]|uniref:methionine ABC transporter ATP-binding protein n=1 Tax=Paenibacillus sp. Leaf72 TaxID=1736234 RepID=UPI0007021DF7|nr:methionine ABC transporter ATP-binding protein [Paenibacillus sp. Leaf72]KQO18455.1 ABC transporter [Paenibacillus sp. Leaf72]